MEKIEKQNTKTHDVKRDKFSRSFKHSVHQGNSYGYEYFKLYRQEGANQSYNKRFSHFRPYRGSRSKPRGRKKKKPSRPPSPALGSEEYMSRKIQQTSAIIMQQLLNPNEHLVNSSVQQEQTRSLNQHDIFKNRVESTLEQAKSTEKPVETNMVSNKNKNKKSTEQTSIYNIEEIHDQIMNHLSNLNDGRKKNLINSDSSGYDDAIQRIQKQKRLEISRALRNMCSQSSQKQESSDFINSIIPDIGIKIEELPPELIEELRNTLNLEVDSDVLTMPSVDGGSSTVPTGDCNVFGDILNLPGPNPISHSAEEEILPIGRIKSEPVDVQSLIDESDTNYSTSKDVNDFTPEDSKEQQNSVCIKQEVKTDLENTNIDFPIALENESKDIVHTTEKFAIYTHSENLTMHLTDSNHLNIDNQENSDETAQDKTNNEENVGIMERCRCGLSKDRDICESSKSNASTTNFKNFIDVGTQTTEKIHLVNFVESFLAEFADGPAKNLPEAVSRMVKIDRCITQLSNYRQNLFKQLSMTTSESSSPCDKTKSKKPKKKRKADNRLETEENIPLKRKVSSLNSNGSNVTEDLHGGLSSSENPTSLNVQNTSQDVEEQRVPMQNEIIHFPRSSQNILEFQEVHEKMLVIKVVDDKLVAAAESGKIFFCSLDDGHFTRVLEVSKFPITSLLFTKVNDCFTEMYVGSFEESMKLYAFHDQSLLHTFKIDDSIQCMESNWGYIFIGGIRGSLLRFSLKKKVVEYEDSISSNSILVLKAAQEGARRILLVGSRNTPICIRDAINGLHLRTLENYVSPTVYSLILSRSLVYCGTTNHNILVFSFHDGRLVRKYTAEKAGIGCMKIMGNLLFASCHNGSIYVYNLKENTLIDSIKGPGGVILSMEVLENQVIVGTMSFQFKSIPIPSNIMEEQH